MSVLSYRHRHGFSTLAQPSPLRRLLRPVLGLAIIATFLYFAGSWVMETLGIGDNTRPAAAVLTPERRGGVFVSLDGAEETPAVTELKLYSGDRLRAASRGAGVVTFFDGSIIRLGEATNMELVESDLSDEESSVVVRLTKGPIWVRTPEASAFSGTVARTVRTPVLEFSLPTNTEALITPEGATVYSADGLGVQATIPSAVLPIIIGEGQQFALPATFDPEEDLYRYRSPTDTRQPVAFVLESRAAMKVRGTPQATTGSGSAPLGAVLTVTSPVENAKLTSALVSVTGTATSSAQDIRINGYVTPLGANGAFSEELSLPDDVSIITVEALDAQGVVLETVRRRILRETMPPDLPTITAPAKAGETYRTRKTEIVIRGTAPKNAAGITVNGYRLQLFKPGDPAWNYLASTKLSNFQAGENSFVIRSMNAAGKESDPVSVTIILDPEGTEGLVATGTTVVVSSSSSSEVRAQDLPQNAPLQPGSLTVTGPTAGTEHTATGSEFLIEGTVPSATASVWVNDYMLRLYTPGKTTWNYIASSELKTLKRGTNTYRIVARDKEWNILDALTYTVRY